MKHSQLLGNYRYPNRKLLWIWKSLKFGLTARNAHWKLDRRAEVAINEIELMNTLCIVYSIHVYFAWRVMLCQNSTTNTSWRYGGDRWQIHRMGAIWRGEIEATSHKSDVSYFNHFYLSYSWHVWSSIISHSQIFPTLILISLSHTMSHHLS